MSKKETIQRLFKQLVEDREVDISIQDGEPYLESISTYGQRLITAEIIAGDTGLLVDVIENSAFFVQDILLYTIAGCGSGQILNAVNALVDDISEQVNQNGILDYLSNAEIKEQLVNHPDFETLYKQWDEECEMADCELWDIE